jgi:hypothetical protein
MHKRDFLVYKSTEENIITVADYRVTAKISRLFRCDHQLPRTGAPAMNAATDGAGPRAASSTTPFFERRPEPDVTSSYVLLQLLQLPLCIIPEAANDACVTHRPV